MRRPSGSALVAGLCAAAGSLSAVEGTRAFEAGAWEVARGGQDCHRSFPAFLWAGSNTGGTLEVRLCVCVYVGFHCSDVLTNSFSSQAAQVSVFQMPNLAAVLVRAPKLRLCASYTAVLWELLVLLDYVDRRRECRLSHKVPTLDVVLVPNVE